MPNPWPSLGCVLALAAAPLADTGSVCLAPLPKAITRGPWHPLTGTVPTGVASDDARAPVRSGQFHVRIDSLHPVAIRVDSAARILVQGQHSRHRLAVAFDGRPVASFPFRFASHGTTDLCLWYHWGYESWILEPRRGRAHGCTCR